MKWRRKKNGHRRERREVVILYQCVRCGAEDPSIQPHPLNSMSEFCCNCLVSMVGEDAS